MKKNNKNTFSFINNFPLIIMVVVAALIIVLVNVYLTFKPYDTIYQTGYMVLSKNMSYNLMNNNPISEELNVGVVSVNNGDSIYKQIDSYYVGEEKKEEIDYNYPVYSTDGLTIYTVNDGFTLINKKFEMLDGYSGLSLNYGFIYNEGEEEPADTEDYLFVKLNNSIFINSQVMTIQTEENEYNIPLNSPMYFNTKYINYYAFDGENFNYNRINDIKYNSLVKIGDVGVTYEELLLNMKVANKIDLEESFTPPEEDNKEDEDPSLNGSGDGTGNGNGTGVGDGTGIGTGNGIGTGSTGNGIGNGESGTGEGTGDGSGDNILNQITGEYVEPTVSASSLTVKTYSINLDVEVNDPAGRITTNPTFEIYTKEGSLYSRKRVNATTQLKMTGLVANTEYRIVGKYTYKDRFGLEIEKKFYEEEFKTRGMDALEIIEIDSKIGARYSNKIEIKDFTILNPGIESLNGVKKITIEAWEKDSEDEIEYTNLSTSLMKKILKGEPTTIQTYANLKSNTVYKYKIIFYDKNNNVLNTKGPVSGVVETSKQAPTVTSNYTYNYDNNSITINLITNNKDDVIIKDFKYEFYKENQVLNDGALSYEDKEKKQLKFEDLIYETEYYLQITGTYDLEDGNGEVTINERIPSKTPFYIAYPTTIAAWYNSSQLKVDDDSIKTNIYISQKANVLSKDNGFVKIYLEDKSGNVINESIYKKCTDETASSCYKQITSPNSYYIENLNYIGLQSNTEYVLRVSVGLLNPDNKDGIDFETDKFNVSAPIITKKQIPYVKINKKFLWNDNFIFEYTLHDKDKVLEGKIVRIDVYDQKCESTRCELSTGEKKELYLLNNVFGKQIQLTGAETKGSITQSSFSSSVYTIAISAIDKNSREYIKIDEGGTLKDLTIVERTIELSTQIHHQTYKDGKTNTFIDVFGLDKQPNDELTFYSCNINNTNCIKVGIHKNDGYSAMKNEFIESKIEDSRMTLTHSGNLDKERVLYVVVDNDIEGFDDQDYKLSSLEYTIGKNIYNISTVEEFKYISQKGTSAHYVVTDNLKFDSETDGNLGTETSYLKYFNGILDFQGYSADFSSKKQLIREIGSSGVLKNIELNVTFDASKRVSGIIYVNNGKINDIIINISQTNSNYFNLEGIIYTNRRGAIINRFAINLKSDLYLDGVSAIGLKNNSGTIKNGYITTHPDLVSKGEFKTVYARQMGMIVGTNSHVVKNVYSLVDTESKTHNNPYLGTILYENISSGLVKNTLSVATTEPLAGGRGPNVYSSTASVVNNYYVDTNVAGGNYNEDEYPFNKKIDSYLLTNTFFMDSLFNDEKEFEISSWNYPALKFSNFLKDKQGTIPIEYSTSKQFINIALTTSVEEDTRREIVDENLNDAQKIRKYQTSKIKIYFNNPSLFPITKINMEDGIEATVNSENTYIDEQSGMTVLDVDLTLVNGIAKSNYEIVSFEYCPRSCITVKPPTPVIVNADVFRAVSNYEDLRDSINRNENILITDNIVVDDLIGLNDYDKQYSYEYNNYTNLPRSSGSKILDYSAKMYGVIDSNNNGKTIDFGNQKINRGYFIPNFSGALKNIQFKGLRVESNYNEIGLIGTLSNATIENVDISNFDFNYYNPRENGTMYIGTLAAISEQSSIYRFSSNNNKMSKCENCDSNGVIENSYIGGIVGKLDKTELKNSYVYKINMENITLKTMVGINCLGGIAGSSEGGQINSVYATGNIISNYSNVGGISGQNGANMITNSYSYLNIFSTGKAIGGIVGNQFASSSSYYLKDIMFIGNIEGSTDYSYIVPTKFADDYKGTVGNFYVLDGNGKTDHLISTAGKKQTIININEDKLNSFDQEFAFEIRSMIIVDMPKDMPYLINSSFVEQQIMDDEYLDLGEKLAVSIKYSDDCEDGLCKDAKGNVVSAAESAEISFNYDRDFNKDTFKFEDLTSSCKKIDDKIICTVQPEVYKDYYDFKIENAFNQKVYIPFYRKIEKKEDWKEISTLEEENILLIKDITFGNETLEGISNKKISNLVTTDNYTIKGPSDKLEEPLINSLSGKMENVNFENFSFEPPQEYTVPAFGLIVNNAGTINNVNFTNIEINAASINNVAIVSKNSGRISNVELKNIKVIGGNYVGGLVGKDSSMDKSNYHIEMITAKSDKNLGNEITGKNNVGGIQGNANSLLRNISVSDFKISATTKIGGIVGVGSCNENCSVTNSHITAQKGTIGGIQGSWGGMGTISNATVKNVTIRNTSSGTYVGGISGLTSSISNSYLEGIIIEGSTDGSNANAETVGGMSGYVHFIKNSYIKDSFISGTRNVGGLVGSLEYAGGIQSNVVSNVKVVSNSSSAGGAIGKISGSSGNTGNVSKNLVYGTTVKGEEDVGGLIGRFNNTSSVYQNFNVKNNLVINLKLLNKGTSTDTFGGIIGNLYTIPSAYNTKFKNSVYYLGGGKQEEIIEQGVLLTSSIGNQTEPDNFKKVETITDVTAVYGTPQTDSMLFENVKHNDGVYSYEYNINKATNVSDIAYVIGTKQKGNEGSTTIQFPVILESPKNGYYIPQYDENTYVIDLDKFISIPGNLSYSQSEVAMFATRRLMMARRPSSNNSSTEIIKEPLDLEVYTVDANKINIDFSGIDEESTFVYRIGDYVSPSIPVVNRTYTITYDFKNPIEISLNSGGSIINKTIKPKDLIRTISYVNGKVYYINNGLLYSEDKAISGNFINLYDNKVLTNGGMIYNISTKEEYSSNVNYRLQYDAQPLYSFNYNGGLIETYYNYSIYNSIIKDYQIILKNGLINIIDASINNKKNSYIIDSYNNNEIQIVLKDDGVLYGLKGNIKYPKDFDNKNITDLYANFNDVSNIAVIKYESGEVYAFNYLTGEKVFTSVSDTNIGFIEYIKDKLGNDTNNSIINLVPVEDYTEMKLLKDKIKEISIEEANNKINDDNSSSPIKDSEYVSVYNDVTQKYDIYKVETLLNSTELQSENEKINRDYELVQFYETLNKEEKNRSLSGIIIFTLSIISILATLYVLVRRKRLRG